MTIDASNYKYRLELAKELGLLKTALHACNINKKSIDSIDRAIKRLRDKKDLPRTSVDAKGQLIATPLSWGYDVKGFVVELDLSSSIQYPKVVKSALVEFSISVNGEYFDQEVEIRDPFKHLEFNIVVEGKSRKAKDHILSYHLDRHIEGQNPSNEVHPAYHFQMGGRKLNRYRAIGKNFGNQLIIDSPRFMHYPMDFVIGLDFVISNFAPDLWRQLKKDNRYIRILKKSQERTLKPFIGSIAHHFGFHTKNNNWMSKSICPQMI
jgi:hypothetical protein